MAKVPRFAEASAGRWPIVEMDNRTATSSSISVLQQPARFGDLATMTRAVDRAAEFYPNLLGGCGLISLAVMLLERMEPGVGRSQVREWQDYPRELL